MGERRGNERRGNTEHVGCLFLFFFFSDCYQLPQLINCYQLLSSVDKCSSLTYIDTDGNWHRVSKGAPEESRTVVAENLPDDHSHQNLQKIFAIVESVKTIRICHPQEPNSSRPKGDFLISNKECVDAADGKPTDENVDFTCLLKMLMLILELCLSAI
ncbi:la-related protein 6C [Medicago truncatula]|uniref:la-related protein 6C n=1 Tax=Medicago truncatula TaxID=3880 RepID=UPI001967AAA4|nr:la-related protein 6C-like [Medicago truncatula]XP_039690502.1 la-related protein 6C-like [Medicago truncatula]